MIRCMRPFKHWGPALAILAGILSATCAAQRVSGAELNPVRHNPRPAPLPPSPRIILKLRAAVAGAAMAELPATRLDRVSRRTGVALSLLHSITGRMQVLEAAPSQQGEALATTLMRLQADPEVEYASVDERRYVHQVATDPLFVQQWYLQNDPSTVSAIDA